MRRHFDAARNVQLATTDSLLENVHFTPGIINWSDLGWKALAINLSDVAAMGGIPKYALVGLALPGTVDVEDVRSFYHGMLDLAGRYGVAIIGGDTDNAPHISAGVTVFGETDTAENILRRSNAKSGDLIAMSGYTGCAAAGFKMLSQKLQFDEKSTKLFKQAFCRPEPRIELGRQLVAAGVKTAIDISDGLVGDLKHICDASRTGAKLRLGEIPIAPELAKVFNEEALKMVLSGGEDYELLFTAPENVIEAVKERAKVSVTIIGEITGDRLGEIQLLDKKGKTIEMKAGGWEHFRS